MYEEYYYILILFILYIYRASFMTGRRPDSTKVWNIINNFREAEGNENWTTMPGLFKKAGYRTLGFFFFFLLFKYKIYYIFNNN